MTVVIPSLRVKFPPFSSNLQYPPFSACTNTVDNWVQRLAGIGVVVAPINAMDARM